MPNLKKLLSAAESGLVLENKGASKSENGEPPAPIVTTPLNPMSSVKGAPLSPTVNKRKRQGEKLKVVSEEEAAAIKAREAARKRVEGREKTLLGLYRP